MRWWPAFILWLTGFVGLVSACSRNIFIEERHNHPLLCNQCSYLNATLVRHILRRHMLTTTWEMFANSMKNLFQQSLTASNAGQPVAYKTDKKLRSLLNSCATNYTHYLLPCPSDDFQYCRWAVWKWNGQIVQASYTCEVEGDTYWKTCSYAHGEPLLGEICSQSCFFDGCNSASSYRANFSRTSLVLLSILITTVIKSILVL